MRILACLICLLWMAGSQAPLAAERTHPDCTGSDRWPAAIGGTRLRELGLSDKAGGHDRVEGERIASQALPPERAPGAGERELFRQVRKITIRDGEKTFVAITVNDASQQECSESGVDVFFIAVECPARGDCRRGALPLE